MKILYDHQIFTTQNYDVELHSLNNTQFINIMTMSRPAYLYWEKIFKAMKENKIDTWDYQWTFTLWNNNQFTVLPNTNMIENVGFGEDATHTTSENEFANLKSYEIFLKNHPKEISQNYEADNFTSKLMFSKPSIFERIINKLKRLFYAM